MNDSTNLDKTKQIGLWLGVVLITLLAFYFTYFIEIASSIKAIVWIIWFIVCVSLAYFTDQGQKVFQFIKEAKVELLKVVWPTRQETIQTTSIVMVMVAVTGFILWGIDSGMMWVIAKITHLG